MVLEPRGAASAERLTATFPAVCAHRFLDAWVDSRSSSVLVGGVHVLSDWAFDNLRHGRVKGASLLMHDQLRALHRISRDPRVIARGIHVGGYHSQNWYHWIAEILPRLALLDRLPPEWRSMPLLVPPHALRPGSFREALVTVVQDHPLEALDESGAVLVRDLVAIDDLILHTPGFAHGSGPRTDLELMNIPGMQRYRGLLRSRLRLTDGVEPGVRVFIDRDHDPERDYNREEILGIARDRGFHPILAERLSFQAQAELFSRAELVIGPNGAGWANVIFSSPGARGLCWLVEEGLGGPWFRNLGSLSGTGISYLRAEPRGEGNPLKVDYWVDPDRFAAALDEVISAG